MRSSDWCSDLCSSDRTEIAEYLKLGPAELAIAGPLDEPWSRIVAFPLFEEPFHLIVNRAHELAGRNKVEFTELASETLLINTECEMVEELKAHLEANGIVDTATHQVATQEDLLALLDANLGVAIIPDGTSGTNGFRSEEHTSELQSLMRISYAVFCLKKKNNNKQ